MVCFQTTVRTKSGCPLHVGFFVHPDVSYRAKAPGSLEKKLLVSSRCATMTWCFETRRTRVPLAVTGNTTVQPPENRFAELCLQRGSAAGLALGARRAQHGLLIARLDCWHSTSSARYTAAVHCRLPAPPPAGASRGEEVHHYRGGGRGHRRPHRRPHHCELSTQSRLEQLTPLCCPRARALIQRSHQPQCYQRTATSDLPRCCRHACTELPGVDALCQPLQAMPGIPAPLFAHAPLCPSHIRPISDPPSPVCTGVHALHRPGQGRRHPARQVHAAPRQDRRRRHLRLRR